MHKTDLINEIAQKTGLTKSEAGNALQAALDSISNALKNKSSVTLIGFGTFKTTEIAARKGRNPQTGEEIKIPASTRAKFTAGAALKELLNS